MLMACNKPAGRDRADAPVLELRFAQQAERADALEQRGYELHFRELLPLVRAADIAPRGPNDRLYPAVDTDIAQLLAALGFTADDVARYRRKGLDPVASAVAYQRAEARVEDLAILADTVALVEAERRGKEGELDDGFYSSVWFKPVEWIKAPWPASAVALRRKSGPRPDGTTVMVSSDLTPEVGRTYLLFASNQLYRQRAVELGTKPATPPDPIFVSLLASPYRLEGEKLTSLGQAVETRVESLADVRQRLRAASTMTLQPRSSPQIAPPAPNPYGGPLRWIKVPATISFYDEDVAGVVSVAPTAAAGVPVRITITSFGGGCTRVGNATVRMTGNTARIRVYDYRKVGKDVICTLELKRLPHHAEAVFPNRGTGRIEVIGMRRGKETWLVAAEGVSTSIQRSVIVE